MRSALSRSGLVIKYAGCPIAWSSKLQSEIALSTTEAEHVALSTSLRDTMSIMQLLSELGVVMNIPDCKKKMKCTVFEDNNGALELATTPKMRLRTKHVAIEYHHFREFIARLLIKILKVDVAEQEADFLTKPLAEALFKYLRKKALGW